MQLKLKSDILVIGGGIIGTSIARQIARASPTLKINLIEKENDFGLHGSTRNTGTIHCGVYYKIDSPQAKHCSRGNHLLTEYHKERKLPLIECGKLIPAQNAEESIRLKEYQKQATINKTPTEIISQTEAQKLEPTLRMHDEDFKALFCPTTKAGSPTGVMTELVKDLRDCHNVNLFPNTPYAGIKHKEEKLYTIKTRNGNNTFQARVVINCAGLYAEKIAKDFGIKTNYTTMPFKGLYLIDKKGKGDSKMLVYPVVPLKAGMFSFIHTTLTHNGSLKLGPTTTPAFWREDYSGFKNFSATELCTVLYYYLKIGLSNNSSYKLKFFINEMKKHDKRVILKDIQKLVNLFEHPNDLQTLTKEEIDERFEPMVGAIRNQVVDTDTNELFEDFLIEQSGNSIHMLNIVSPGWTCALSLAEEISDRALKLLSNSS